MATTEAHVGETGKAVLTVLDATGTPTSRYEDVQWTNSNPAVAEMADLDTNPLDQTFTVVGLGSTTIGVSFDKVVGEGSERLAFEAELVGIEGDASSATFELIMDPVEPPA